MAPPGHAVIRSLFALTLVLGVGLPAAPLAPPSLERLAFLLGTWETFGSGTPGEATERATFAMNLENRIMTCRSYGIQPATGTTRASRHDHFMVIYATADAGMRADYYDSEGHVIHYVVTVKAPGETTFVSDVASDGPRYQLTYTLGSDGVLKGVFAVAPPGKSDAFAQHLAWEFRKAKTAGSGKRE